MILKLEIESEYIQTAFDELLGYSFIFIASETAIKYMENDLVAIEQKITQLKVERKKKEQQEPVNMSQIMSRVKYFLENLDKLLVQQIDPVKKAQFFSVFFSRVPTYEEIKTGTENKALITGIAELFKLGDHNYHTLVGHHDR